MGNFDFLLGVPRYRDNPNSIARLEWRFDRVIEPFRSEIVGSSVLDLGAHDGRWAYVCSVVGASRVTAIEARNEIIGEFDSFPKSDAKKRVSLLEVDVFSYLEDAVRKRLTFDVVLILGFLYHTAEHYRLFVLVKKLNPKFIIVDSEFIKSQNSIVQFVEERTDKFLNGTESYFGQSKTIVGIPSDGAMEKMARSLNYNLSWIPNGNQCATPADYERNHRKRRRSCYLTRNGERIAF